MNQSQSSRTFTELPPLALYIHLPWCIRKCPYCDFNSHEQKSENLPEDLYVNALISDLEQEVPDIWGRQLASIFIGGGTPSLFSPASIEKLLSGVRMLTAFNPDIEITMEANPGTFEQEKFKEFHAAGINRLSIGIQSFNESALEALGRVHDATEAKNALHIARNAGFENINLDLMFGLPGQTGKTASDDINTAISLEPEHISYYQLTLEPNTLFAARPPVLPEDERIWNMQEHSMATLAENNYRRYEISAYAKPRKESQHNVNYWLFGDYLGIGAGAHGKLSFADRGEIRRRWKTRHPESYLEHAAGSKRIGGEHTVSIEDTGLEFMMNALRLTDGFSIPLFQQHTGIDLFRYQPVIDQAIEDDLLEQTGLRLRATRKGYDFLNDLLDRFMERESSRTYPIINLEPRSE